MALLYLGGIAQEYHLFDWIDRFNWTIQHHISVEPTEGEPISVASTDMFPHSVRGFIIQSYLLPMRWMRVPRPLTGEMRNSVLKRAAERFVRVHGERLGGSGTVIVESKIGRLDKRDLEGKELWETRLMEFRYDGDKVDFHYPRLPGVR